MTRREAIETLLDDENLLGAIDGIHNVSTGFITLSNAAEVEKCERMIAGLRLAYAWWESSKTTYISTMEFERQLYEMLHACVVECCIRQPDLYTQSEFTMQSYITLTEKK